MKTILEIRARREQLVVAAARQRAAIAMTHTALRGPAETLGRGLDLVSWLRCHPLAVGAAATALVVVQPRRALRLAARGLVVWRSLNAIGGFIRKMGVAS